MAETQDLTGIVDVEVLISPLAAPRLTFNVGLIVGNSAVISAEDRIGIYTGTEGMVDDGFTAEMPEYKAAVLYFSQSPRPRKVMIGRKDDTANETWLEALQACREKSPEWYIFTACGAAKADHEDLAEAAEAMLPSTRYWFSTKDADVPAGTAGNIFLTLKALLYKKTLGVYSTSSDYAAAAAMGVACGLNNGLANSAFTMKFKNLVGLTVESLTTTEISNIENANGNIYLNYGNFYNIFEQGKNVDGSFVDEGIFLDMLTNDLQLSVMDVLYGSPKVPQTDPGVTRLIHACNTACEKSRILGFLAPGQWGGIDIYNLKNGDTLPKGYLVQAQPLEEQSQADREVRKSPPLYVAIKESGAVHSVVIGVYVNR